MADPIASLRMRVEVAEEDGETRCLFRVKDVEWLLESYGQLCADLAESFELLQQAPAAAQSEMAWDDWWGDVVDLITRVNDGLGPSRRGSNPEVPDEG